MDELSQTIIDLETSITEKYCGKGVSKHDIGSVEFSKILNEHKNDALVIRLLQNYDALLELPMY